MARVLKPGGRVAVSDLALLKPLPPAVLESVEASSAASLAPSWSPKPNA